MLRIQISIMLLIVCVKSPGLWAADETDFIRDVNQF